MRLQPLAIFAFAGSVGCAQATESPSQTAARLADESAAAKLVIDSLNAAYFQVSPDDILAQYAEDAEVVAGPMELKGRAAIGSWINFGASVGGTMRLRAVSVSANGPWRSSAAFTP